VNGHPAAAVLGAWSASRSAVRRGSEPTSARVRWVAARPTGNEAAGSKAAHQRPTLQLPAELPGGGGWWLKENEPTSGGRLAEGRQQGDGGGGGRPAKSESTLGRSQRLGYNHDRRPRTAMVVAKEPSNPYRRSSRGGEGSRLSRSTTRAPRVRPAPWCGVALAFRAGAIRTTRTNDKNRRTLIRVRR